MSIKRALVSVSNKEGLVPFVQALAEQGVEIISTGGTSKALQEAGVKVTGISEVTGFPEIMDGRVKTLHPMIHGGLLAVRDNESHVQQMEENGISPIDLVVVNLYPFKETIAKENVAFEDAIENIDIGGPSMLRSAAKNHAYVTVVVDPADYSKVLEEVQQNNQVSDETRKKLAAKTFRHTAAYDALIAEYLTNMVEEENPESFTVTYEKKQDLRYGENPHQKAAFYKAPLGTKTSIAQAEQLHGKELSYNNINDADAALQIVREFSDPAVVAVKHMNPCGVGTGSSVEEAFARAFEADPISIFGGIIASNVEINAAAAQKMSEIFLEIVIAPSFSTEAKEILTKKKNIRLLTLELGEDKKQEKKLTTVRGGLLVQDEDAYGLDQANISVPTKREPTEKEWEDLKLAWKVVKHIKSNAIVLTKDQMTIGVGAGQMNRVGAANIAIEQAGEKAQGSALGSDAFFPMDDTVEAAAKAGITAIIQPGGSVKDEDSIKKADEYGIAMVFTGVRHFKH
ncbi:MULTISPECIES: bifunctional phosphoribosylaminoimidazolecarboxamide formyltransferase/IMP cyclohydrolase [Fictibacillus]|uniref:Bifunctional purine biosynthesis protein PurH n=1 Tax=Fictibacillus enclensis TaxID=1017270 RepID=A0A0V8J2R2_9BACL|nr:MULTISPECIES: bifunctional phosphoribosylaminoimidazolecarboxamide formyltransferase/IMP cyclohydrolase [Fictibacillus]KSU81220.1 bifunctional phosphoribosylaminoimidazolecarboxamide formyltransferase/inosine monophosphate cyclohydrolase [Fictibacillus enclensis]RXZ00749.1 bifunctional phosphoribosylaminoimidazolecarboxamide formyltransferase/IMP cyclohydrolase PurH [Fictibacillus sp. S7]SCC36302.1 phosphoribosylaminoimidazolecarboxamide formyltransferase / IMP cyclohydrolase [Fictibacillus e